MSRLNPLDDYVWCDVHSTVHPPTTNPYDGEPTEVRNGRPVWLTYTDSHGGTEEMPPECQPCDWRKLWIGGGYRKPKPR